jgi:putative ABC transport system permease protein
MFKNHLKIAVRNLLRQKAYSLINVSGLAIGMACCLFILLYVRDELSYDRHHEYADRIYHVGLDAALSGKDIHAAVTGAPLAGALVAEYPEVEAATRLYKTNRVLINHEQRKFYEERFLWADSTVFQVLSFPLLRGDEATALNGPHKIVLTTSVAHKYFGDLDPLGKVLRVDNRDDYVVTGVLRDQPANTQFQFDFLASLSSLSWAQQSNWVSNSFFTYVRLRQDAKPENLAAKFPALIRRDIVPQIEKGLGISYDEAVARGFKWGYFLELLPKIYLHSTAMQDISPHSDIRYIYILSAIALFILLIACINFMNLATARSAKRAKEVGVRRVLGSERTQLARQFLGEFLLLALLAMIFAHALVQILLPWFNQLVGKTIAAAAVNSGQVLFMLLVIALSAGLLAGLYPAFVLSAFQPVRVLKGQLAGKAGGTRFRSVLVVAQFSISLILLVGTFVVFKQLRFMQNHGLGFAQEQVLIFPAETDAMSRSFETVRSELLKNPQVLGVAAGSVIPGRFLDNLSGYRPQGAAQDAIITLWTGRVTHEYLQTLQCELVIGRDFSREIATDADAACVINESAAQALGWTPATAIGKQVAEIGTGQGDTDLMRTVVGVVKDFHFESLQEPIKPVIFTIGKYNLGFALVRARPENLAETLAALQAQWQSFLPDHPSQYFFLDEDFGRLYEKERRLVQIVGSFAFFAMFIACFGLFGMASYMAQQRTKEIAVRKVLGASVRGIMALLSQDFVKLVLLANIIAWPIAYFVMNWWLQDFAYRIDLGWLVFALAGGASIGIALLTVSTQAIKAALANPANSLRYE